VYWHQSFALLEHFCVTPTGIFAIKNDSHYFDIALCVKCVAARARLFESTKTKATNKRVDNQYQLH